MADKPNLVNYSIRHFKTVSLEHLQKIKEKQKYLFTSVRASTLDVLHVNLSQDFLAKKKKGSYISPNSHTEKEIH